MVNQNVSTCMLGDYKVQPDGISTLSGDYSLGVHRFQCMDATAKL